MNIQLKNADFSANKISVVPNVVEIAKTETNISLVSLGNTFNNGQTLRWRLVIDDVSTYNGVSVPFGFAVGSSTLGNIGSYEIGAPQTTIDLAVGASAEGFITLTKIAVNREYVKFATYNVDYNSIKWHIEYYIV